MSGVGSLTLVDGDQVSLPDLNRQGLFSEADIGRVKVEAAKDRLLQLNSEVGVVSVPAYLSENNYRSILADHDVVIDGTDALTPRLLMNGMTVQAGIPTVFGGAVGWTGYVATCVPSGPCFRCIWPIESLIEETCSTNGIFGPVVGQIGAAQASEAIRIILGIPKFVGRMLLINEQYGTHRILEVNKKPNCLACGRSIDHQISSS